MNNPISTYRIQFHKGFTFADLKTILSYLKDLGIGTLYASPVFTAVPGSTHGYDGVNPLEINPEIGTVNDLHECSRQLRKEGIGWLQDIVPNHMGYHSANGWLMDLFERGSASAFYHFFDVYTDVETEPIMAPFLGESLEDAVQKGDLKVLYNKERCYLQYFDQQYPLRLQSYGRLFGDKAPGAMADWLQRKMADLSGAGDGHSGPISELFEDEAIKQFLDDRLDEVNGDAHELLAIAQDQYYRLCSWSEADERINYRRFFTISSLICIRIQDAAVFQKYHRLIAELVNDGTFTGVRIDHIDGLYNPQAYLADLRKLVGEDTYITVEKILEPGEQIPSSWAMQGPTGYEFLGMVNQLLTNQESEKAFTDFYAKLTGDETSFDEQLLEKKSAILFQHMQGELSYLVREFETSGLISESTIEKLGDNLKNAIAALLIYCPVYRYYPESIPLQGKDEKALSQLLQKAEIARPELSEAIKIFRRIWVAPTEMDDEDRAKALHLLRRCMQFSGPLMAKGKEDTLMYTFNRFIAHNEVGDSSARFGITIACFHEEMIRRQSQSPLALNATTTHDTKRGEDMRARLVVLADMPEEWLEFANDWIKTGDQKDIPGANERYLLLKTIVGSYPMPGVKDESYLPRLKEYLIKALREGKTHSDWVAPNEDNEKRLTALAESILNPSDGLQTKWHKFQQKIADFGIINSLVQVLLKCTCPGVPDIYQGSELWDLRLVDPDNRRPVDYKERERLMKTLPASHSLNAAEEDELWNDRYSGRIKLWLTTTLLNYRKKNAALFNHGMYVPLEVKGEHSKHVIAFARRHGRQWVVVAAGVNLAVLCRKSGMDVNAISWDDTHIVLPPEAPWQFKSLLNGAEGNANGTLPVSNMFSRLPYAIIDLTAPVSPRKAGVLMAISSLPSQYGIGDLGPAARDFVDFLSRSCQRMWQLLPLNPIEAGAAYSPYSSISAMAGNQWLISVEDLQAEGLLLQSDIEKHQKPPNGRVDYDAAIRAKKPLLDNAYQKFLLLGDNALRVEFEKFCRQEAYWLHDFALFSVLKKHYNAPWNEWPDVYKNRDNNAIKTWAEQESAELNKVKWLQFIFDKQWKKLRAYCDARGVELLGDLPFYVSYDSVDVWTCPQLFSLDKELRVAGQAGVPPDYFSEDGQLWGMPTYNWTALRDTGYGWWVKRLERNLTLFDKVRIDHFRAFQAYWEVPAGEKTARNGSWIPGPGKAFFNKIKAKLGGLPFVAEDLGDEMEPVYVLRDQIGLPGMRVLQFGFGDNMPYSVDIPHNYVTNCIVYTGTHDNNTTLGWFTEEAKEADRKRVEKYVNISVTTENVHKILAKTAYASVAETAILPAQDILGLGPDSRMNTPGTGTGNWTWALKPHQLNVELEKRLRDWAIRYNRF